MPWSSLVTGRSTKIQCVDGRGAPLKYCGRGGGRHLIGAIEADVQHGSAATKGECVMTRLIRELQPPQGALARRHGHGARRFSAGAINFIGADTLYGDHRGAIEHHPFLRFELCYYRANR
jgi:hypothetical protein